MECVYFLGVRNILAIDINMPAPIQKHFPFAILDIEHRASQMLASAIQKKDISLDFINKSWFVWLIIQVLALLISYLSSSWSTVTPVNVLLFIYEKKSRDISVKSVHYKYDLTFLLHKDYGKLNKSTETISIVSNSNMSQ